MTQVESSDLYVESTEFLDAWIMSELELFTSAVASYFLDKTYFYSHYREGEQETDMMACGWYSDLMDTQAKLLKICDALCIDRERLIKLFRLLQRWEQAHPKTSFPLRCHLEAIKRYLIEKPLTKSAYAAERFPIRTQDFCAKECFLNLYTYPETLGLCVVACCTCAEEYGFRVESTRYRYMLRCTPLQGWYHLYLYCYSKEHMKQSPSECKEVNVHGA